MKELKFSVRLTAICETKKTRSGTREFADLYIDGKKVSSGSDFWSNRPWYSYTYQNACFNALRKVTLSEDKRKAFEILIRDYKEDNPFKSMAMVMKMGELLTDNKKEANDWKLRMAKAGMGEGIDVPADWDTLSEDEKERRLNAVIDMNLK